MYGVENGFGCCCLLLRLLLRRRRLRRLVRLNRDTVPNRTDGAYGIENGFGCCCLLLLRLLLRCRRQHHHRVVSAASSLSAASSAAACCCCCCCCGGVVCCCCISCVGYCRWPGTIYQSSPRVWNSTSSVHKLYLLRYTVHVHLELTFNSIYVHNIKVRRFIN